MFVYGTLRRGQGNHFSLKMDKGAIFLGESTFPGTIYTLGGFPGVRLGETDNEFVGELYQITDPELFERLDRLEGFHGVNGHPSNLYDKHVICVSGRDAYVYEIARSMPESSRIESGDWLHGRT